MTTSFVLKLDLDYMRESLHHALCIHEESMNSLIKEELDKVLSEYNLREEIRKQLKIALDKSVKGISNNYELQVILANIISTQLKLENSNGSNGQD